MADTPLTDAAERGEIASYLVERWLLERHEAKMEINRLRARLEEADRERDKAVKLAGANFHQDYGREVRLAKAEARAEAAEAQVRELLDAAERVEQWYLNAAISGISDEFMPLLAAVANARALTERGT